MSRLSAEDESRWHRERDEAISNTKLQRIGRDLRTAQTNVKGLAGAETLESLIRYALNEVHRLQDGGPIEEWRADRREDESI